MYRCRIVIHHGRLDDAPGSVTGTLLPDSRDGAEHVGEPEVDETAEVRWVPVDETPAMIARGDILGAITIIGVQHALLRRVAARVPPR